MLKDCLEVFCRRIENGRREKKRETDDSACPRYVMFQEME